LILKTDRTSRPNHTIGLVRRLKKFWLENAKKKSNFDEKIRVNYSISQLKISIPTTLIMPIQIQHQRSIPTHRHSDKQKRQKQAHPTELVQTRLHFDTLWNSKTLPREWHQNQRNTLETTAHTNQNSGHDDWHR